MPRQRDLFIDGFEGCAQLGHRALALAQFHRRVQAGGDALLDEAEDFLALGERALQHRALVQQPGELHVLAHEVAGQQQPGGLVVGLGGVPGADGGVQGRALAPEGVDLPAAAQQQAAAAARVAGQQWRIGAVGRVALAVEVQAGVHARQAGRVRRVGLRLGALDAQLDGGEAGVGRQPPLDEFVQPPVREGGPPAVADVGRRCRIGHQHRRVGQLRPGRDAAGADAAGEQQRRGQSGQCEGLVSVHRASFVHGP